LATWFAFVSKRRVTTPYTALASIAKAIATDRAVKVRDGKVKADAHGP
jgi:hypothetical protein